MMLRLFSRICAGPLAVVNSSMDSLFRFAHLSSIGGDGGSYVVNGVGYAAVVTGLGVDAIAAMD